MGMASLHDCFRRALRHPAECLDLAVIAHCASGWSAGKDGAERLREWCEGAAPTGGQVRFHWPRRGELSILGKQRASTTPRDGFMDCEAPAWLAALPLVELGLREDVVSKGERSVCRPLSISRPRAAQRKAVRGLATNAVLSTYSFPTVFSNKAPFCSRNGALAHSAWHDLANAIRIRAVTRSVSGF